MFLQYQTLKVIMSLSYITSLVHNPCYCCLSFCILLTNDEVYMETIISYFATHTNTFTELYTHIPQIHIFTQILIINRLYKPRYTISCTQTLSQLRSLYKTTSNEYILARLPSVSNIFVNLVLDDYFTGYIFNG